LELGRLLVEATDALSRLDYDTLGDLERRALNLHTLLAEGARLQALPALQARHRVFAAVVAATGKNLAVLERAGSRNPYGRFREDLPWAL